MPRTVLFIQGGQQLNTRTYNFYDNTTECLESVCRIFEDHLRRSNPNTSGITYDISQLFDFIDQVVDLACLVHQETTNTYVPHDKDWMKQQIYDMLRVAAKPVDGGKAKDGSE